MGFILPGHIHSQYASEGFSSTQPTLIVTDLNSKPATFTEMFAVAPFDVHGFWLTFRMVDSISMLVDIAIGAASSEVIIAPDVLIGNHAQRQGTRYFPVFIPSGVRISARAAGSTADDQRLTMTVAHRPAFGLPVFRRITAYGATLADSGGINVDPGGSANTMGSYSEITSGISDDHAAWCFILGLGSNYTRTDCYWLINIAKGAAASETELITDYPQACDASHDNLFHSQSPIFHQPLDSGVRLAAQAQCSITEAADRLLDCMIYGLD